MAKKKKTRKQKILADQRRETFRLGFSSFEKTTDEPSVNTTQLLIDEKFSAPSQRPTASVIVSNYGYVFLDLKKTVIITSLLVIGELLLRYLIK